MLPQAMHPMSSSFLLMTHIIGDHLQAGKATVHKVDIRNQFTHLNIEKHVEKRHEVGVLNYY
jgi:hypothetical protein